MIAPELLQALLDFRSEREWEKFHSIKNLACAITVEAAELLECFQWSTDPEVGALVTVERERVAHELADIGILLSYLCHDLGLDLDSAIREKLELNRQKYPVALARGMATKYDRL